MALERFKNKLKSIIGSFKKAENKVVRVGVVGHQHYDDKKETPVAYVAAIHEYGSPDKGIPARPFMRPTVKEKNDEWRQEISSSLKAGIDTESALASTGETAAADVVKTISEIMSPPLALSTKKARDRKARKRQKKPKAISVKPLVDSGLLIASISSEVVDKK